MICNGMETTLKEQEEAAGSFGRFFARWKQQLQQSKLR